MKTWFSLSWFNLPCELGIRLVRFVYKISDEKRLLETGLQRSSPSAITSFTIHYNHIQCFCRTSRRQGLSHRRPIKNMYLLSVPPSVKVAKRQLMVYEGEKFELRCSAAGIPLPRITWQRVHGRMPSNVKKLSNGVISFLGAMTNDSGFYQCVAKNSAGTSLQTVILYVRGRPVLLSFYLNSNSKRLPQVMFNLMLVTPQYFLLPETKKYIRSISCCVADIF